MVDTRTNLEGNQEDDTQECSVGSEGKQLVGQPADGKRQAAEPNVLEPVSDTGLPALQKAVRDQYRLPRKGTVWPRKRESMKRFEKIVSDSGKNINAPNIWQSYQNEAVSVKQIMSDVSAGLATIHVGAVRIERSIVDSTTSGADADGATNRYMLGTEFAIAAIVAVAGLTKRRADLSFAGIVALTGNEKAKSSTNPKEKLQTKVLYRSPRLEKRAKDKIKYGVTDDTPEWLISLDGSAAAEAGYLYASVLRRPTILMTQTDTFTALAEKHFHDAVLGWLIVDLNLKKLKEIWKEEKRVIAVSNGETIELPVWEDIVEFYQHKPKEAKPDNLITVVLKRNLDRELIEAALASIITPQNASIRTYDSDKDA